MVEILLIASFAVGYVYRFSLFSPEIKLSPLDCSVFLLIIKNLSQLRNFRSFSGWLFVIIAGLSLLLALPKFGPLAVLTGSLYLLRWLAYSLLVFIPLSPKTILGLGLVTPLIGLTQYFFVPDVRFLKYFGWDDHYYRLIGQFLDPNFTGLILVLFLVYLSTRPINHFTSLITWYLSYLALALTYSRSSYLAFLVAMAHISWKLKGWKFFIKVLFLFALTLTLLPRSSSGEGVKLERTKSVIARTATWHQAWALIADHPLLGVGFNVYRYAQPKGGSAPDSSYLFLAATTGFLGLIAYFYYLKQLVTARDQLLPRLTILPVLVHSLFTNSLFYPPVLLWLSLITARNTPPAPFGSHSQPGPRPQSLERSLPNAARSQS